MQTTDLTTKEAELNIIYGPFYKGEKVDDLNLASVKYMYTDLTDIRKYYIRLGFHLYEFYCRVGYMSFGYSTLYDFCEANLGLDKSAVSRCMNVYREFNAKNDVERIGNYESHGCSMDLSERWKDYSYTQLCELLSLSEDERKKVTPDMTVKQIREYKKALKGKPAASKQPETSDGGSVASTQPEDLPNDTVASTQLFDFNEYGYKKGIVLQNYIKKCDPIKTDHKKLLYVFDSRGKEIISDVDCDILLNTEGDLVVRMYASSEPLEFESAD